MPGHTPITNTARIKTDWAALVHTRSDSIIVCVNRGERMQCICFDSLQHLRNALTSKHLIVKKWAVAVPETLCIIKPLTLPASDITEAADMIEFELPSLVPLSPQDVVYGCTLLNRRQNLLSLLVYIIRANSLYQHLEPYKTAGIEPHQITIDPLAIHHWFTSQNNDSLGTRIGVLINCSHCVVITSVEGNFQRAHQLTLSGSDEHLLTQNIISEVRTQIDNFVLMEKREPITLLAASREQAMRLRDTLTDRLNDSEQPPTVVITTTPTIIHWGDNHEQPLQDSFAYEAVTAEGLLLMAMTSKLPHANLLPRQYIRKHQQRTFLFNASFACILSVFALVLLWVGFAATNRRIARAAKPIENQITPIQHIAQSIERKRQRLRAIRDQISSRGQITQILKELYQYTPNSISLSKFRFATSPAGVSIQIKGQAKMMANPFDYAELMQKSTLLGNLQVENVQQVPRPGGSIVEFQAQGTINKRAGT